MRLAVAFIAAAGLGLAAPGVADDGHIGVGVSTVFFAALRRNVGR